MQSNFIIETDEHRFSLAKSEECFNFCGFELNKTECGFGWYFKQSRCESSLEMLRFSF